MEVQTDSENYCRVPWRSERNLDQEESPSVNLVLGIGIAPGGSVYKRGPIFTAQQLQELNHQALIFNYLSAGLCVPGNLIAPILKSGLCSSSLANLGFYSHNPRSLGYNHQDLNQRTVMDLELGRCRRTDGKKWRCSNNAINNQKYCERHMNRGQMRSRKHVEASQNISVSHQMTDTTITETKTNDSYLNSVHLHDRQYSVYVRRETCAKTTSVTVKGGSVNHIIDEKKTNYVESKDDGLKYDDNMNTSSNNGSKSKLAKILSRGFESPQINVPKGGTGNVVSGSTPCCESTTLVDELKRCKRTDGKKWRCKHEVLAEQKYCAQHMNRGVRKTKKSWEMMVTVATPIATPTINLNASLSINEGDHTSSSDATTITDEHASFVRVPVLFPAE